jgi:hypothetical protein
MILRDWFCNAMMYILWLYYLSSTRFYGSNESKYARGCCCGLELWMQCKGSGFEVEEDGAEDDSEGISADLSFALNFWQSNVLRFVGASSAAGIPSPTMAPLKTLPLTSAFFDISSNNINPPPDILQTSPTQRQSITKSDASIDTLLRLRSSSPLHPAYLPCRTTRLIRRPLCILHSGCLASSKQPRQRQRQLHPSRLPIHLRSNIDVAVPNLSST